MNKAMRQGICPSFSVFPIDIIAPILHTHLDLHVAFNRRKRGDACKSSK
jgi:hypothetical protein